MLRGNPHQVAEALEFEHQVHVGSHRLGTGGQTERCANWPRGGQVRENRLGGPRTGPLRLEVAFPSDDVLNDAASIFELDPYLIEVKATTTGQARLTTTQAATASQMPAQYVLCVVDLRQVSHADLETGQDC